MGDRGDGGVEMPPMDIGALEVLCRRGGLKKVDEEFLGSLPEASYLEALDLMADEEVAKVRMELQKGIIGVSAAYSLAKFDKA
jgi:hypothetical protein